LERDGDGRRSLFEGVGVGRNELRGVGGEGRDHEGHVKRRNTRTPSLFDLI
jgi:hypothetical protein